MMLTREQSLNYYHKLLDDSGDEESISIMRELCKEDLFFLLVWVCHRQDINRDWLYNRIREVEANPDGYLDVWAREHYKSTIITFGKTIQDILNNPNITVGIFSHTKSIAKGFLFQIKSELQGNTLLKSLFPDILYEKPETQAPKWSVDAGIIVKRTTTARESTVEAHGLVDSMPTGRHYDLMIYDDVVTEKSVSTPEQIAKTTEAWELSIALGSEGGKSRYIGTRYHYNDTYKTILERGVVKERRYPGTDNGKKDGNPVLFSKEYMEEKRKSMGPYTFACQILLDPRPDDEARFLETWLRYYSIKRLPVLNRYILVDPANSKKKGSDYTAMWVIGMGPDENIYVVDAYRDRLNLKERTELLFKLHRKYKPLRVGYEKYSIQADIDHIREKQEREMYRFEIAELRGNIKKEDRILKLVPWFSDNRIYLPMEGELQHTDYQGKFYDPVREFIMEYLSFPFGEHEDMLDALARLTEPEMMIRSPSGTRKIGDGKPTRAKSYSLWSR